MPRRERAIVRLDSAPPTFNSRCEACRARPGCEGVPSTIVSPTATTSTTGLTRNPFLRTSRKCKRCGAYSLPGTSSRKRQAPSPETRKVQPCRNQRTARKGDASEREQEPEERYACTPESHSLSQRIGCS